MQDESVDKPYFHYYSQLHYQQNMLQDNPRTFAYYTAITQNPQDFNNKVVFDIGTGSGILSFFAAQSGAKTVYAIEASHKMASFASKLISNNNLDHVIKVIPGKIENLSRLSSIHNDSTLLSSATLLETDSKIENGNGQEETDKILESSKGAEKLEIEMADIIMSEPMGVLLVHERMLSSYIEAARKWLKPSGKMYPDRGTIFLVPITDFPLYLDSYEKCKFWNKDNFYNVNLSSLKDDAKKQYFSQLFISPIETRSMMANPCEYEMNFTKMNSNDLDEFSISLDWEMSVTGIIHGIGGWFNVSFPGSDYPITFSTSPHDDRTHWHQCKLLLEQPLAVNKGSKLRGNIKFTVNNERSYDIRLEISFDHIFIDQTFHLNDQQYWNLAITNTNTNNNTLTFSNSTNSNSNSNNYHDCNSKISNEYDKEYYNLY